MNGAETGVRLHRARLATGLSQAQLALRAGVSERTIRALEAGEIARPRPTTVHAVLAHLRLTAPEADAILRALGSRPSPEVIVGQLSGFGVEPRHWPETFLTQARELQEVSRTSATTVDARRRIAGVDMWRVFRCVTGGVDRLFAAWGFDPEVVDPDLVEIEGRNCRAGRRFAAEPGAIILELLFDQRLAPGATFGCGYRVSFERAFLTGTVGRPSFEAVDILHAPGALLTLRVQFASGQHPTRLWQMTNHDPDLPRRDGEPLALSPFGLAHIAPIQPVTGANGIAWDWPD